MVTQEQMARPAVLRRLAEMRSGQVMTSVVTMSEQLQGRLAEVHRARSDQALQLAYERLQTSHQYYCRAIVLPFNETAAGFYNALIAQRLRVGTQDLRIAAITLANDAILVTGNRRDFDLVRGLRIEEWTLQ